MEHIPSPGELVIVDGKHYTVTDQRPYTKLVERGGPGFDKWMSIVHVAANSREGRPGRGAAVEG